VKEVVELRLAVTCPQAGFLSRKGGYMNLQLKSLILLVVLTQTGCGTIRTITAIRDAREKADKTVLCNPREWLSSSLLYSGTYDNLVNRILNPFTCEGDECYSMWRYPFKLVGALIDLPPAIVADSIMLAYTVPLSLSLNCDEPEKDLGDAGAQKKSPDRKPGEIPQTGNPSPDTPEGDLNRD
jgi:hypothetical protein